MQPELGSSFPSHEARITQMEGGAALSPPQNRHLLLPSGFSPLSISVMPAYLLQIISYSRATSGPEST